MHIRATHDPLLSQYKLLQTYAHKSISISATQYSVFICQYFLSYGSTEKSSCTCYYNRELRKYLAVLDTHTHSAGCSQRCCQRATAGHSLDASAKACDHKAIQCFCVHVCILCMCADHQQQCLARLLYTDTLMFLILYAVCALLLSCFFGNPAALISSRKSTVRSLFSQEMARNWIIPKCSNDSAQVDQQDHTVWLFAATSNLRLCMFFVCTHNAVRHRNPGVCRLLSTGLPIAPRSTLNHISRRIGVCLIFTTASDWFMKWKNGGGHDGVHHSSNYHWRLFLFVPHCSYCISASWNWTKDHSEIYRTPSAFFGHGCVSVLQSLFKVLVATIKRSLEDRK